MYKPFNVTILLIKLMSKIPLKCSQHPCHGMLLIHINFNGFLNKSFIICIATFLVVTTNQSAMNITQGLRILWNIEGVKEHVKVCLGNKLSCWTVDTCIKWLLVTSLFLRICIVYIITIIQNEHTTVIWTYYSNELGLLAMGSSSASQGDWLAASVFDMSSGVRDGKRCM